MKVDLDSLSEDELRELNRLTAERLNMLYRLRTHARMLDFRLGERISFQPQGLERQYGVVIRLNTKTITVVTDAGERWTVSPSGLRHVTDEPASDQETTTLRLVED